MLQATALTTRQPDDAASTSVALVQEINISRVIDQIRKPRWGVHEVYTCNVDAVTPNSLTPCFLMQFCRSCQHLGILQNPQLQPHHLRTRRSTGASFSHHHLLIILLDRPETHQLHRENASSALHRGLCPWSRHINLR